jgi:uncharacterized membrane protein
VNVVVETEVEAGPERTFAVLADYEADPKWRKGVVTMRPEPAGPARAGTRTLETLKFMGSTFETPGRVVRVVPGELLEWEAASGAVSASGVRRVERLGEELTRVTYTVEARFNGAMRLVEPLYQRVFRRQAARDLDRLRALVEDES